MKRNTKVTGFGNRLRELRKAQKLTADELGKMVQLSQVSILRYENEQMRPNWDSLEKLSEALNTTIEFLRYGKNDLPLKRQDSVDTAYEMSRRLLTSKSDLKDLEKLLLDFVEERVKAKIKT
jgi:transcriptional regulator with XRE-family HTH domain